MEKLEAEAQDGFDALLQLGDDGIADSDYTLIEREVGVQADLATCPVENTETQTELRMLEMKQLLQTRKEFSNLSKRYKKVCDELQK